jgi:hypothetical protein
MRGRAIRNITTAMPRVTSHHSGRMVIPSGARKMFVRAHPPTAKRTIAATPAALRRPGSFSATAAASIAATHAIELTAASR